MKKIAIYFLLFVLIINFSFSQSLKDKNILVVWGGWDGHKPELFVKHIEKWLIAEEANYKIINGVKAYDDYEELIKYDLIIQSITMGNISKERLNNLLKAVGNGVGFSGAHGGIADSFRNNPSYQFMVGGQWVSHPDGKVNFKVNILEDEITNGILDFELFSEQWYVHYDPNIDIIATTTFSGNIYPWINKVVMPIAWKKKFNKGKIFCLTIGHDPEEFTNNINARKLLHSGLSWAAR
mgnify:FL=1